MTETNYKMLEQAVYNGTVRAMRDHDQAKRKMELARKSLDLTIQFQVKSDNPASIMYGVYTEKDMKEAERLLKEACEAYENLGRD